MAQRRDRPREAPDMTVGRPVDPAEVAAAEFLADPGRIQRRLDTDLAQVARLGRGQIRVDPSQPVERLVLSVREQADRLGFATPVAAVVAAKDHIEELPLPESTAAEPVAAYHLSAARTVANGEVVREHVGYDGTVSLVFQRQATEPNHTTVRLEAVVAYDPDGTARLTRYGWPTVAIEQPVHGFGGSVEGYADQVVADLREAVAHLGDQSVLTAAGPEADAGAARDPDPGSDPGAGTDFAAVTPAARAWFARAMLMAFGFTIAQTRDGHLPADRLIAYQDEIVPLVAQGAVLLADCLETAFDLAERGGLAGWTGACARRSGVESLFAGFLGSAAFELVDAEVLTELHQVIDEAAEDLPQVGRPPEGLPRHHDWWYPGRSL